jgi:CheY-like chemotaxis protein
MEPLTLEPAPLVTGKGETVLVVEDDAAAREALVDSLELLNYQVLEATNGREALALFERHQDAIALVLSDMVMPGMGGKALAEALRQQGLSVPVVVLSGHALASEIENLRAAGLVVSWMQKPVDLEQLAKVIGRELNRPRRV